jgi:hypothetical protein
VADITSVKTHSGLCHVAFVIDVFSRRIVGWQVSTSWRSDLALDALDMSIYARDADGLADLVHHNDRGLQGGLSIRYTERLAEAGIAVGREDDAPGLARLNPDRSRVHVSDESYIEARHARRPRRLADDGLGIDDDDAVELQSLRLDGVEVQSASLALAHQPLGRDDRDQVGPDLALDIGGCVGDVCRPERPATGVKAAGSHPGGPGGAGRVQVRGELLEQPRRQLHDLGRGAVVDRELVAGHRTGVNSDRLEDAVPRRRRTGADCLSLVTCEGERLGRAPGGDRPPMGGREVLGLVDDDVAIVRVYRAHVGHVLDLELVSELLVHAVQLVGGRITHERGRGVGGLALPASRPDVSPGRYSSARPHHPSGAAGRFDVTVGPHDHTNWTAL